MENIPAKETGKSIFRNVLYSFSTWFVPLGLSFLATPLIVRTLGNQDYGIYALVLGVIGYSFNLNFGRAVTKYIAEYRATGETEKIRDVISAALFINLIVGIAAVLIIVSSAKWLVNDVFQIAAADQPKTIYALYIAALAIFSLILSQVFNSILQGIYRFDVYSKIFNFNNVATLLGNLWLAYNNFGLIYLLAWNLLTNVIAFFMFAVSAKRLLPEFGIKYQYKPKILKLVLKYSAGIISYQILGNFLMLFERGWITRQLGAESLTYYVVPMSLSFYIHGFVSSIILVVFPLASELQDNKEKLLRLYHKASKIVCFFVFFLATLLIVESRLFLTLWMGADFAEQTYLLLIIHTITFSLVSMQAVSWQMTEGLGHPSYNTLIFVICLVINVFLIISVTEQYGNTGVAFARLIVFGLMFLSVFYVERWVFKAVQFRFWLNIISRLAAAAAVSAVTQIVITNQFGANWLTFLTSATVGGTAYCLVLLLLGFMTEEEKLLLKNLLSRKKLQ